MKKRFPIDNYHRPWLLRIGQHEAAHYISSRVLGFDVGSISVTIIDFHGGHNAGSEITLARGFSNTQDVLSYIENRIIVLYAGALGESLSEGRIDNEVALNSIKSGGAMRDHDKVRELVHLARNIKFPAALTNDEIQEGLDKIDRDLWNRAATLVEAEHSLISQLGARIASEIKYTGQNYVLQESELKKLPLLVERFG